MFGAFYNDDSLEIYHTINGSSVSGLGEPDGITMCGVDESESLTILDAGIPQAVRMKNINSDDKHVSTLIRSSTSGTDFYISDYVFADIQHANDLSVSDYSFNSIVLFFTMQMTHPPSRIVTNINQESKL